MSSICCSPPESVPATWRRRSLRRGNRSYTSASDTLTPEIGWVNAPISRFSSTVMLKNTRRPSGTCASPMPTILCGAVVRMSCPSKVISPVLVRSRPEIVLSTVLLPAPLAPISVTISPGCTWKDTSLMAWMLP